MYRYFFLFYLIIIATVVQASCDPFTIECRTRQAGLTKYPLSVLSMKGYIEKTDKKRKVWALIQAPDHHIYSVMTGDMIGIGGGQVIHISAQNITVQEGKNVVTMLLQQVK
jgi:Tfp pilus assembly protein PilP